MSLILFCNYFVLYPRLRSMFVTSFLRLPCIRISPPRVLPPVPSFCLRVLASDSSASPLPSKPSMIVAVLPFRPFLSVMTYRGDFCTDPFVEPSSFWGAFHQWVPESCLPVLPRELSRLRGHLSSQYSYRWIYQNKSIRRA